MAKNEENSSGVTNARVRLNVLLRDLIKKTEESNEGEASSPAGSSTSFQMPPPSTPTKRSVSGKTPRKRRKKDVGFEDGDSSNQNPSFVMKLFDRSVDFAQFNEDTPLYALARAWMQNKPYGTKSCDSQESSQDGDSPSSSQDSAMSVTRSNGESDPKYVYSFPDPIKSVGDVKMNIGGPKEPYSLDINYDVDTAPSLNDLKRHHIERWKRVKTSWREKSFQRQARCAPSIKKIRELFEHQ